jgi:hypothetical protein
LQRTASILKRLETSFSTCNATLHQVSFTSFLQSVNQENVSNNQSSEVEIQRIAFKKALLNLHGPWLNACQNELEAFRSNIFRVNQKLSLEKL